MMLREMLDECRYRSISGVWRCVRHRVYSRNLGYFISFFLVLYVFYYTLIPSPSLPLSFPSETRFPSESIPAHVWDERASRVKEAFQHAYRGYTRYASPHDELKPLSDTAIDNFNGWGVSAFDALDTMLLMGLEKEYKHALSIVEQANFTLPANKYAPFFETTIRYLGGLLSAHALSHEPILLIRADELARLLDPIFNTTSGLPLYAVNPHTGETAGPLIGILAEVASLQLEYTYLAKLTGKSAHLTRANKVIQTLARANLNRTGGMFPIRWNLTSGQPFDAHTSVGAQADSAHEYLLKQYLLTNKTDKTNLEMYIRTTTYIITNLLYLSPNRHLLYVTDTPTATSSAGYEPGLPSHTLEHLSCFLPGLLALGAHTLPLIDLKSLGINLATLHTLDDRSRRGYKAISSYNLKQLHLWAAEGLATTCWLTYADQPSGLSPEEVLFHNDARWNNGQGILWINALQSWKKSGARGIPPGVGDKQPIVYTAAEHRKGTGKGRDYLIRTNGYFLRPETIESLYILWRVTGHAHWRDRGWKIFEAIEKQTKTSSGYASLRSVEQSPAAKDDSMPSYFLAETLKYLYLLFNNDDPLPLDKWVFNTEAHPFPVFEWTEHEKDTFSI